MVEFRSKDEEIIHLQSALAKAHSDRITHLQICVDSLNEKVDTLSLCVRELKTTFKIKGGMLYSLWGLLGGAIPAGVLLIYIIYETTK